MFERLRSLFASSPAGQPGYALMSAPLPPDTCQIRFHPELIPELRDIHAQLLDQLRSVISSYRNGDPVGCVTRLEYFDGQLRAYLIMDGVRFSSYMSYVLQDNPQALQLMRNVRIRLRELARQVHEIANSSRTGLLQPQTYHRFGRDLNRLSDSFTLCLLTQREQLFPLYRRLEDAAPNEQPQEQRSRRSAA